LTKVGALHFDLVKYDVNNINLNCIDVKDSQTDGILVRDGLHKFSLHDINLNDINIINTGTNQLGSGYGMSVSNLATGWVQNTNVNFQNTISGNIYESSPTFEIRTIPTSNNQRPIAIADSILYLASDQTSISIDGSRSYDPEGKILSYSWVQIAGRKVKMDGLKLPNVSISGLNPEEYIFKLCVNDSILTGNKIIYIKPNIDNTILPAINYKPSKKIVIFPNPVKDEINLNFFDSEDLPFSYRISDICGRSMMGVRYHNGTNIQVKGLEKGIYFIEIQMSGNKYLSEFIKC